MNLKDFEVEVKLIIKNKHADPHASAMGRGIVSLCRLVDQTGSLNKAAKEMGMAYSKAWSILKRTEEAFGFPLLTRKGNKGSELTDEAREIIALYTKMQEKLNADADKLLESAAEKQ